MEAYGATRWGMIRYPSNSSLKNAPLAPRITPQDIYFDQEIPDFHLDDVEMNDSAVPSLCSSYSASPSNSFYNTTPPNGAVNKRSSLSSLKFSTSLAQVTSSLASALHLAPPKPQKMVRFSDEVTIIPGGAAEYFEEDEEDFIYGGQETELESQSCQYEKEVEKYAYRPHTPHPHSHASHHHSSRTHPNDAKLAAAREEQRRRGSLSRAPSSPHHNGIWGQYSWEKFPLSPSFDLSGFMKFGSRSSTPAPASSQKSKPVRPRPAPIQTAPMPAYSRKIPIPSAAHPPSPYYGASPPSPGSPPTPRYYGSLSRQPSWQESSRPDILSYSTSPPLPTFEDLNNYSHHNQRNQKLQKQGSGYFPTGGYSVGAKPTSYVDCRTIFGC